MDTTTFVMQASVESSSRELLVVEEVAKMLRCSHRSVYELVRRRAIPHRRLAGTRRLLFYRSELRLWLDGVPIDVIEFDSGARLVRPADRGGTYSGRTLGREVAASEGFIQGSGDC